MLSIRSKPEVAAEFAAIGDAGWNLERENNALWWCNYQNNPKGEKHGPCEDDEEVLRTAHVLYEQTVKDHVSSVVSTPEVEAEARPRTDEDAATAALRHKREDDELGLFNKYFDELKTDGHTVTTYPESPAGYADLYSPDALVFYRFRCTPDAALLKEALAELAAARDHIQPVARAVLVSCCIDDIEALRNAAIEAGAVEVSFSTNSGVLTVTAKASEPEGTPMPPADAPAPAVVDSDDDGQKFLVSEILIKKIVVDPALQSRVEGTSEEKIEEYTEAILHGAVFPPVRLFYDGHQYILSRGFHRVPAHQRAGKELISCEVKPGGRREALLDSLASNTQHGLPRSRADKRMVVTKLLSDPEWAQWSDGAIAKHAQVSQSFVSTMRRELTSQNILSEQPTARIGRDGVVRDTANIGREQKEEPPPAAEPAEPEESADGQGEMASGVETERTDEALLAVLKFRSPEGVDTDELLREGYALDQIQRLVSEFRVERLVTGKCYYVWTVGDIGDEVRGRGVVSPQTFSQLGVKTSDLAEAERRGVVARRADGWYVLPKGAPASEQAAPTQARPSPEGPAEIADDIRRNREEPPAAAAPPAKTLDDLKAALKKHRKLSRLELEEMGFSSSLINSAVASKAVTQPETGIFALRPSVEELLKGRDLRIDYIMMGEMPGQATVQVCIGDDIEDTLMEVIDFSQLRPFPDSVMEMIARQAGKKGTPARAAASKAPAAKPAARKAAAKKPAAKKAAKKTAAKKSAGKRPAAARR